MGWATRRDDASEGIVAMFLCGYRAPEAAEATSRR